MFRCVTILALLLSVVSCTQLDFQVEELQPVQSNITDGELSILVLTESTFVSREANAKNHSRKHTFPPRFLFHVSASTEYKGKELSLNSFRIVNENGKVVVDLTDQKSLILRDSWYKDIEKYQSYGHLKNYGGTNTVRDIYISRWLPEIELNKKYFLTVGYTNLLGESQQLEIAYIAKENNTKGLVPTDQYWDSI